MRHLLSTLDLTRDEAIAILDVAEDMADVATREVRKLPTLRGKTVVNLFFEDSTRTRISFEAAAKRLSADVINFSAKGSSVSKGESLKDTAQTLAEIIQRIEPSASPVRVGSLDVTLYRDDLAHGRTRTPSRTQVPGSINGTTVVLVDDVLYSGRTIRSALDALGDHGRPTVVRLAVLVDRGHRELPIRADFVGRNLPTATDERINVHINEVDGDEFVSIDGGSDR